MNLEERAAEAAARARCTRCQDRLMEAELIGLVTGSYRAVAINSTSSFQLCGECGLKLREFLTPELESDHIYNGFKALLRKEWRR